MQIMGLSMIFISHVPEVVGGEEPFDWGG